MNWLKIGDRIVNLDRVQQVERDVRESREGVVTEYVRLYFRVGTTEDDEERISFVRDDARRAWEILCDLVEHGDAAEPPSVEDLNRRTEQAVIWTARDPHCPRCATRIDVSRLTWECGCGAHGDTVDLEAVDSPFRPAAAGAIAVRCYRILDPEGRRSGPDGTCLGWAQDLRELPHAADRVDRDHGPGTYPIAIGPEAWGTLRVYQTGEWKIQSDDGRVTLLPGAMIL